MTVTILIVFTSVSKLGGGGDTGWSLPEAAYAYHVLSPHFTIDFAAPGGPNPPMDPSSGKQYGDDDECNRFLGDPEVQSLFKNAKRLDEVTSKDYEAACYLGGRGSLIDLPSYWQLVQEFFRSGKLVCAISNGAAAFVNASRDDKVSIINGKEVTALSKDEEYQLGGLDDLPFFIEDRLKLLGGNYEKAKKPWEPNVVRSGNLITGQNPASAKLLAQTIKEVLQKSNA